ncbi:MAG: hypothetical protein HY738_04100, partial [Bacteroidia bacterium]|nr:hypothetical protein [Bacteroidia bacterium]
MIIYSLHLVFTILFFIGNPWCCKKNNSILKFTNFQENTVDQYEKYRYKLDSINITWKFQNTDGVYNCKDCIKSSDYKSIAFFNINSISISEIKNLLDDSILFNIIFNQYSKF